MDRECCDRPCFCLTRFISIVGSKRRSVRYEAMVQAAVARAQQAPCTCEGCLEFIQEMDSMA